MREDGFNPFSAGNAGIEIDYSTLTIKLAELDVGTLDGKPISISSLATGDVLQYNGTDWVNAAISAGVNSVSNSDGTLTISPTTGDVVASLNLGHANTWTAQQIFNDTIRVDISGGNKTNIEFVNTFPDNTYNSIDWETTSDGIVGSLQMFWDGTNMSFRVMGLYNGTTNQVNYFEVYADKKVNTYNNTLDDGSGNMSISGNYQISGTTLYPIGGAQHVDSTSYNTQIAGGGENYITGGLGAMYGGNAGYVLVYGMFATQTGNSIQLGVYDSTSGLYHFQDTNTMITIGSGGTTNVLSYLENNSNPPGDSSEGYGQWGMAMVSGMTRGHRLYVAFRNPNTSVINEIYGYNINGISY